MKSMTGFASLGQKTKNNGSQNKQESEKAINYKIKSVNNRFLDLRLHCPQDYLAFEKDLRALIQKKVHRGTVDVYIQTSHLKEESEMTLDHDRAKFFLTEAQGLAKKLKIKTDVSLDILFKFGSILKKEQTETSLSISKSEFLEDMSKLLDSFDKERSREGLALAKELKKMFNELETSRVQLQKLAKDYPAEIRSKIEHKLKAWTEDLDPQRMNQELIYLIDKSDIEEEIIRLKEHIKACLELLKSKEPQGKKLDFYAQELFREMNTIGSKSSSVKITGEVMEGKAIIEKIRQQVQNIE